MRSPFHPLSLNHIPATQLPLTLPSFRFDPRATNHHQFCPFNPCIFVSPNPPPDSCVWRFPTSVPAKTMPLVCTSENLSNVPLATLNKHIVPTSLYSSIDVQAAPRSQTNVISDFMQPNSCSSSSDTIPIFVTPINPQLYGATVLISLC